MKKEENDMDYEIRAEDLDEIRCEKCDIAFRTRDELDEHNKMEHNMPSHAGKKVGKRTVVRKSNVTMEEDNIIT